MSIENGWPFMAGNVGLNKLENSMTEMTSVEQVQSEQEIVTKKPLVIYHANCADGFSAAWCFHHFSGHEGFDYHPGVYQEAPPDVTGRIVYLVDFSYKRAVVEEMLKAAKHIYLIDHHKTALEDLASLYHPESSEKAANMTACTDLERSGAMLAWDFLFNSAHWRTGEVTDTIKPGEANYVVPPTLLGHIQDRDLWKFKLPLTREIQANVFSYEYTFENWDKLMLEIGTLTLAEGGAAIERKHHKDIAELLKVCQRMMTFDVAMAEDGPVKREAPVASMPYTFSSDAGHKMASEFEEGAVFAACYSDTADRRIFSLRSTPNGMDVSEIAKLYGGGGHKNAAGFSVPRHHILARS